MYLLFIFDFRQGVILLAPHISSNLPFFNRLEQFNDILFQENRLVLEDGKNGNVVYPDSPLICSSEVEFMSTNKAIHLEPITYQGLICLFHFDNCTLPFVYNFICF